MKKVIEAMILGEKSAGLTALQIYQDGILVWSHSYFTDGATSEGYARGLRQAIDDALRCGGWRDFKGCDRDEDGSVIDYSQGAYAVMSYDPADGSWALGEIHASDCQAKDLIKANADRLPQFIADAWGA
jgi:hypothetical protein